MSDQITAALQADDVYELIGLFDSLEESTAHDDVVKAVPDLLERVTAIASEAEQIAFFAEPLVWWLRDNGMISEAVEAVEACLKAVSGRADDTSTGALRLCVNLAASPIDENGVGKPALAEPYIQALVEMPTDSFDIRETGHLLVANGLGTKADLIALAKRLEKLDLSVSELCDLAMDIHGDNDVYEGGWNIGDHDWARQVYDRAVSESSSSGDKGDLDVAARTLGIA